MHGIQLQKSLIKLTCQNVELKIREQGKDLTKCSDLQIEYRKILVEKKKKETRLTELQIKQHEVFSKEEKERR